MASSLQQSVQPWQLRPATNFTGVLKGFPVPLSRQGSTGAERRVGSWELGRRARGFREPLAGSLVTRNCRTVAALYLESVTLSMGILDRRRLFLIAQVHAGREYM